MKTYFFSWEFKTGTSIAVIYSLAQRLRSEVFFLFRDNDFDFDAFGFWRHLHRSENIAAVVSGELEKLKEFIVQKKELNGFVSNINKIAFAQADLSAVSEILRLKPDLKKTIWNYTSNDDLLVLTGA